MILENKGRYVAVLNKENGNYVIQYVERGRITVLEKFVFVKYDRAEDFINNNIEELDAEVTRIKKSVEVISEEVDKNFEKNGETPVETPIVPAEETTEETEVPVVTLTGSSEETVVETPEEPTEGSVDDLIEEPTEDSVEESEDDEKKKENAFIRYLAGFLAAVVLLTGGHFIGSGISKWSKNKSGSSSSSWFDGIMNRDEELNNENFEKLAIDFAKQHTDKGVNVSTEDLVKFVSIINIDRLCEENPELAKELFGTQIAEEYLSDAAKVIGMTYTYNRNVFETEQSTKNFIRISTGVNGSQKEVLQKIEAYVDRIAETKYDAEQCNQVIAELIVELGNPNSELSYLDDGVGFGMQVYIELIRSYLAKDVISKENLDYLSQLTSSEKYVSNIFTEYRGCSDVKTKTK